MSIEHAIALNEAFCVAPPTYEQWMARRDVVTGLGVKYYDSLGKNSPPEKFQVLERELERSYCSGAYLACVVFAAAIVELFLQDVNEGARDEIHEQLDYIKDEIAWLKSTRNDIAHYLRAPDALSMADYIFAKGGFEVSARQAIAVVYQVARAYVRLDPNTALQGTRRKRRFP
ncbi:hypothetical protein CAP31_14310 [Sulfuriferula sp. AH1]|uniref:hypothetical protein n=1 Tax=Sulfuriferula sp. AH1 TaxID=1985873 RepID=UPI000B3B85E7|nr:hypothetical protein [Sulfuriferula sp. AH1]ARU32731.1 hypothetical protein CAP31_14310 [Sulfuriferula sp. AH1]